ncbi:hypothetical protein [Sphingomonas qomolangmaensis]|uniref:UDP-glucose 6-dehydrogenase n=1 Tax=Sphingomonas qomolangmaensis TaxID=2918765 RepID=A0ABY5L9G6_9SPHN|nr:hypothetical protein [Sphingomonas qomolangmaensis]UUL82410.1 hypothetical protein NMP03_14750 [Sphingomonas qomolangmaensis]
MIAMYVCSAEFTKYVAKCMLGSRISFMNEMANLAELLDADIEQVRRGVDSDPRNGHHFIDSGIGYGGSCFPKDVSAMIHAAMKIGYDPLMLHAVEPRNRPEVRAGQPGAEPIRQRSGRRAVLSVGARRKSQYRRHALGILPCHHGALVGGGGHHSGFRFRGDEAVSGYSRLPKRSRLLWYQGSGPSQCRRATDCDRAEKLPGADLIRDTLSTPLIFGGRNVYHPAIVACYAIRYHSIGRPVAGNFTKRAANAESPLQASAV